MLLARRLRIGGGLQRQQRHARCARHVRDPLVDCFERRGLYPLGACAADGEQLPCGRRRPLDAAAALVIDAGSPSAAWQHAFFGVWTAQTGWPPRVVQWPFEQLQLSPDGSAARAQPCSCGGRSRKDVPRSARTTRRSWNVCLRRRARDPVLGPEILHAPCELLCAEARFAACACSFFFAGPCRVPLGHAPSTVRRAPTAAGGAPLGEDANLADGTPRTDSQAS